MPPLGDGPLGRIFLIWCLEMAYSGALLSRRSRKRLSASVLSIRLFVDLSVAKMQKTRFSQKLSTFRAMVTIDDLQEVVHGLFKEAIIGPLKSKMAEIHHVGC